MKYCTHCGKELMDEAVVCPGCGCAVGIFSAKQIADTDELLHKLSQRINTNGIIWLVIGILQILAGIFFNWILLIVGGLNIASSAMNISYGKAVLHNPSGIVKRFEPLAGPVISLVYNLIFGGVVGIIGNIYYLVQIRNFVLENRAAFESLDNNF